LSASASPAFGPCGIPFELDAFVDGVVDDEVAAGADDFAAGFDGVAACVDGELLALEPQAAAASAARTSRTAVRPRRDRVFSVCIIRSCL
jgi:hypothetical protein